MQAAIVLDGHIKSALSAVRSLGMQRIPVYCGAARTSAMACHSKYATERFVYPSPIENQEGFVAAVRALALRIGGKPVIFSFSDATLLTLYQHKDELASCATLVFPSQQSMEIAFDKAATYSEAKISGIPTIETFLFENVGELSRLKNSVTFPMVIKPRRSLLWKDGKGVGGTASFVHSFSELEETFIAIKRRTGEAPLIQQYVEGEEYGVEMLCKDGEVLVEAAHHRLRSMSPTGGASVLKETVGDSTLIDEMREHAYHLTRVLSWTGPIMVEFKVDSDTRTPKLMEINGRFWGSLPLAIAADINFPHLYYALATEKPLPATRSHARAGVVTRHFLGDVRHVMRVLFAREKMRSMIYPTRRQAIRDFFRVPKGTKGDVWRWLDPLPSFYEYIDVIAKLRGK